MQKHRQMLKAHANSHINANTNAHSHAHMLSPKGSLWLERSPLLKSQITPWEERENCVAGDTLGATPWAWTNSKSPAEILKPFQLSHPSCGDERLSSQMVRWTHDQITTWSDTHTITWPPIAPWQPGHRAAQLHFRMARWTNGRMVV